MTNLFEVLGGDLKNPLNDFLLLFDRLGGW